MDNILYCSNLLQLKQELKDNGFYNESDGSYAHGNTLTPIKMNAQGESLSLVRNNKLNLDDFPSLTNLGSYEEMFPNEALHSLYKRVHPYDIPLVTTDEEDNEVEYYLPKKIGVFA